MFRWVARMAGTHGWDGAQRYLSCDSVVLRRFVDRSAAGECKSLRYPECNLLH